MTDRERIAMLELRVAALLEFASQVAIAVEEAVDGDAVNGSDLMPRVSGACDDLIDTVAADAIRRGVNINDDEARDLIRVHVEKATSR